MAHEPGREGSDGHHDGTPMDGDDDRAAPMDSEGTDDGGTPVEQNGAVPFCGMK